jgi:NitT/TauT family transport system permease protein
MPRLPDGASTETKNRKSRSRRSGRLLRYLKGPRVLDIHQIILPPLSRVLQPIVEDPQLYLTASWQTFQLVIAGFVLGALLGILGAIAIFYSAVMRRAVYPYLFAFRIVPKVAFLPLFILWFGVGAPTKILLAAAAIFFLVLVQMLLGLQSIDEEFVEFGRSLTMTEPEIFRKIRVPVSMPCLMVGLKLGVTYALTNVIVAEMVVAHTGLGVLLVEGRYRLRTYEVLAAILVTVFWGLALYAAAAWTEKRTTSWHYDE